MSNVYVSTSKKGVYTYTKKQMSVLSTSMLTASIGFIATCLIGYLTQFVLTQYGDSIATTSLYIISSIGIIIGTVLSFVWTFRWQNASLAFGSSIIALYCICYGIGFGFLFYSLELSDIIFAFGMVGLITLGSFIVSKVMSVKAAYKFSQMAFVIGIVGFVIILVCSMVAMFTPIVSTSFKTLFLITSIVSGIISIIYLIYSLWLAQNMDKFINDAQLSTKLGIFLGFNILVQIITLTLNMLRFIRYFKN